MTQVPVQESRERARTNANTPAGFDYVAHYNADGEFFDYDADVAFAPDERRRRQIVLDLAGARAGESVLDVGSGSGWLARALDASRCRVTALDLSLRNLRGTREGSTVRPVLGESARPPFASDAFDRVIAIEVIEHLTDPALMLREMRRVLKPGGTLVIAVPYNERIEYNICIHCNQPTPKSAHLHSFSREALRNLLSGAGFEIRRERLFLNKGISLLRLNAVLGWLPYPLWRAIDGAANRMTDRVRHIGIVARKNGA